MLCQVQNVCTVTRRNTAAAALTRPTECMSMLETDSNASTAAARNWAPPVRTARIAFMCVVRGHPHDRAHRSGDSTPSPGGLHGI